jgi:hypothetical protein
MKEQKIATKYAPLTLCIELRTEVPTKLHLTVYDAKNEKRKFTERYKTITGNETLFVRMPLSPDIAVVEVVADKGGIAKKNDDSFEIVKVYKKGLERRFDVSDIGNAKIRSFVRFAQKFSFNVQDLEAEEVYKSDDGQYFIQLKQTIRDAQGKVLTTPARIGRRTGIIQVSKEQFTDFTVPMRMAILLHEFSHFYLNEKMDDEMEADLNGLLIYLGLGYPRIEAYQAFLETFKNAPNTLNKNRYDMINKFINDFEKMDIVIE